MEGFGHTDVASYNYGSVQDGYVQNPTLEQRLKKKYWKTKQTVITKLKREEDEHVVAGDADIDVKLEKARHLETSCLKLLQTLTRCSYHTQALSSYESSLSEFLISNGEIDFTHAGDVMKKVGEAHDHNAKMRVATVEPILRLQQEFSTFSNSAIGDLSESIKRLEKARVDYRAALLWMKDASMRLHDPDARAQLAKFREVQATVKDSKSYFEKMKFNLIEKINMVAASRCNLLSRTLPQYQTEMLSYLDQAANELHKLLVILRSQTQHQYKLNTLMDEIRDLEGDIEVPAPDSGEEAPSDSLATNSDNSLFGLLQQETTGTHSIPSEPMSSNLPVTSPPPPAPPVSDVADLLALDEDLFSLEGHMTTDPLPSSQRDLLTEEWDEYSVLDTKTTETPIEQNVIEDDNWTDDLVEAEQPSRELNDEVNELMALDAPNLHAYRLTPSVSLSTSRENEFDPVAANSQSESAPQLSSDLQGLSLHPGHILPTTPLMPMSLLPTGNTMVSPVMPPPKKQTMSSHSGRGSSEYRPMVGSTQTKESNESSGQKWANLFAHLDPIANEKA